MKPDLFLLKTFSCEVMTHIREIHKQVFDEKSEIGNIRIYLNVIRNKIFK